MFHWSFLTLVFGGGDPRAVLLGYDLYTVQILVSTGCGCHSHNLGWHECKQLFSFPQFATGNFCPGAITGRLLHQICLTRPGISAFLLQIPFYCAYLKFLLWWLVLWQVPSVALTVFWDRKLHSLSPSNPLSNHLHVVHAIQHRVNMIKQREIICVAGGQ